MKRRKFISVVALAPFVIKFLGACKRTLSIKGKITGASASIGHILRDGPARGEPSETIYTAVAIIGGGVSGLSAARQLKKNNINDFVLLELEEQVGGNSSYAENKVSAYPLGAHYVPLPNDDLPEYREFLQESNIITSVNQDGKAAYNELFLCFDSQERLFINGQWQEGLVPQRGLVEKDKNEVLRFLAMMHDFKNAKGSDERYAFAIPVNNSSTDKKFTALDSLTMKEWMLQQDFKSEYLHWYVNYCTRDDFGTPHQQVSAWVGIHYFASRRGSASNASDKDILTWPEGNGFLVKQLKPYAQDKIKTSALVLSVKEQDEKVVIEYLQLPQKKKIRIIASQCIIAAPQFVAARLLNNKERLQLVKQHYNYTPWMVANISCSMPKENPHVALSWDNVMYNSNSLGYVDATHQLIEQAGAQKNFTYYLPFNNQSCIADRLHMYELTHEQCCKMVVEDMEKAHPGIGELINEINITKWGHSMVQPKPGHIFGKERALLSTSLNSRIHFAHTDNAGISIFEEAFYQGIHAANKVKQFI